MADKVVFLDRDGTINVDKGYLDNPDDLELLPGAGPAVAMLNNAGYKVVVISNQSGISRGMYTEETVNAIHIRLKELLASCGAKLDGIFYCPHQPADKCSCRKPKTGLADIAIKQLKLKPSWADSWMIGDKISDVELGQALGCRSILLGVNPSGEYDSFCDRNYIIFNDLLAAAEHILKGEC